MARQEKDKLYYEITKEKAFGNFQMLLVGGSAGSITGFLIASLVGAYEGIEMDSLVLAFLIASILGFFFGAILIWLFIQYFGKFVNQLTLAPEDEVKGAGESSNAEMAEPVESEAPSAVVENEESKGKSIDFMFPEFSPDKQ